jgi:hypothetical protein
MLALLLNSAILFSVREIKNNMKKTTKNIKWLINDLGLNELGAWLCVASGAALTAAVMVFALNL